VRCAQRHDPASDAGRIFGGLRHLLALRAGLACLGGGALIAFWSRNPAVLGFTRPAEGGSLLVLANFSEFDQPVAGHVFSAMPAQADELITGVRHDLHHGLTLAPYQMVWLEY
jgi:amylosucrase